MCCQEQVKRMENLLRLFASIVTIITVCESQAFETKMMRNTATVFSGNVNHDSKRFCAWSHPLPQQFPQQCRCQSGQMSEKAHPDDLIKILLKPVQILCIIPIGRISGMVDRRDCDSQSIITDTVPRHPGAAGGGIEQSEVLASSTAALKKFPIVLISRIKSCLIRLWIGTEDLAQKGEQCQQRSFYKNRHARQICFL